MIFPRFRIFSSINLATKAKTWNNIEKCFPGGFSNILLYQNFLPLLVNI